MNLARALGKALREYRLKKGLTQQELADKCGLDISYVGGIERGQRSPTPGCHTRVGVSTEGKGVGAAEGYVSRFMTGTEEGWEVLEEPPVPLGA